MKKVISVCVLLILSMSCQPKTANENAAVQTAAAINTNSENQNGNSTTPLPLYSPTPSPISFSDISLRIGTIELWGEPCFIIQNPELKPGDKVEVIMLMAESPQKVFHSEIVEKSLCKGNKESTLQTRNATEYSLKMLSVKSDDDFGVGVGIVNSINTAKAAKGIASMDIDGDGKDEYFRSCSGPESFLLAVWKGQPLIGKRIWHSQYYLKYDAVKTCKKKDWEGLPDE